MPHQLSGKRHRPASPYPLEQVPVQAFGQDQLGDDRGETRHRPIGRVVLPPVEDQLQHPEAFRPVDHGHPHPAAAVVGVHFVHVHGPEAPTGDGAVDRHLFTSQVLPAGDGDEEPLVVVHQVQAHITGAEPFTVLDEEGRQVVLSDEVAVGQ